MASSLESLTSEVARLRDVLNDLRSIMARPDVWSDGEAPRIVSASLDAVSGIVGHVEDRVAGCARELAIVSAALQESQRNSLLTLNSIPGLVALLTTSGDVEFVNRQILEYTGQTLDELKHWGTNGTVHAEDLPHVIDVFTHSIGSGSPYEIVQRLRRSDGAYRWFQNNGFPIRDNNGEIARWCVLLTDIDERKRAEDELRDRERESRLIVDSIPAGAAIMTKDGEVEFVNKRILDYFGRTLEDLQRWGSNDSVHPDDLPRVIEGFVHSLATGDAYDVEERLRRFDGVYRWFQVRGLPLRDSDGRVLRWYVLHTDIDDRKRAEAALRSSQADLKLIIDTIPALAWSARTDGSAEFFNQHYLDFIGLSADQASNWGWTVAVHPDDMNALAATWQGIMASQAPGEAEARLRRHDGVHRWFLFRTNPLRDESGAIVRWYGVNTDIQDRKQAEVDLRRAYDSFADAQRLSHTGNFTADIVADEHVWSDELRRIFEFAPDMKVTVQAVRDVIHPDDLPSFDAGFAHSLSGADFDLVFRIVTRSGRVKHVRSLARLAEHVSGRPLFIGAIQDVTENRVAEEALNQARSELAHVARVTTLSTLTASIAHEVNQPLSGIMTNAGTCLRMLDAVPPNLEGARETARRTIRDGNRASEVIARLRALYSKREFTLEPLDLNEAVREVIALSRSDLQRNRVVLHSSLAADLPNVTGDRIQLQQVLLNLFRNASDAMMDVHDRPRQLLIKTEKDEGDRVRVTVRDTGLGVDSNSTERLFDAFYTTKGDGMGMGLSISRSIVERHQGRLWAEPNDGPGATFAFSIPAEPGARTNTKVQ